MNVIRDLEDLSDASKVMLQELEQNNQLNKLPWNMVGFFLGPVQGLMNLMISTYQTALKKTGTTEKVVDSHSKVFESLDTVGSKDPLHICHLREVLGK